MMAGKTKSTAKPATGFKHLEALIKSPDFALIEWLSLAKEMNVTVPDTMAEKLLDAAVSMEKAHPLVASVLGEGGWQKAREKSRRMYVLPFAHDEDVAKSWSNGDSWLRLYLFKWLIARDRIQCWDLWKMRCHELKLIDRLRVLDCFRNGICETDEAHLEAVLEEEENALLSQHAAALLALIPSSAYNGRAFKRAAGYLSLVEDGTARFDIKLPKHCDWSAMRDGVDWYDCTFDPWPPAFARMGKYCRVLYLMLCFIDPNRWREHFDKSPSELILMAKDSDPPGDANGWGAASGQSHALVNGFEQAAVHHTNEDFAEALICHGSDEADVRREMGRLQVDKRQLTRALSPVRRERLVSDLIRANNGSIYYQFTQQPVLEVVKNSEHVWSSQFARHMVDTLRSQLTAAPDDHTRWLVKIVLPEVAKYIPEELFEEARRDWPVDEAGEFKDATDKFINRIDFRAEYLQSLRMKD